MRELIDKYWIVLVAAVLLIVSAAVYNHRQADMNAAMDAKQTEISQLKTKLMQLDHDRNQTTQIWQQDLNGLDIKLDSEYRAKIDEFMKLCTTWTSFDEYTAAREKIMTDYDLSEDSSFMRVFMPQIGNIYTDGKNINKIDVNGLNMRYEGNPESDFYVTGISESGYDYFCIVKISTRTKNPQGTATGESTSRVLLTCTVSPDGAIVNPEAFPLWLNGSGKQQSQNVIE